MVLRLITVLMLGTMLAACNSEDGTTAPTATAATAATAAPAPPPAAATSAPDATATVDPIAVATAAPTHAAAAASAPAADGEAVFRAFVDAVNDGDVEAAAALFTTDASWERGGQCPPGQCVGIERLRQEIERDVANNHRLRLASAELSGSTMTARVELQTDQTRAAGVERLVQIFTIEIAGGKIAALDAANDTNDATTAAFMRQRRGR